MFPPYNNTEIKITSIPIKKAGPKLKPNNGTAATAAIIVATAQANHGGGEEEEKHNNNNDNNNKHTNMFSLQRTRTCKRQHNNYHHNHYLFTLGAEWFPTRGTTRLGLRFGLGAYGELETVETDPPSPGGGGWVETVVPGLVLERDLGGGRRVVVRLADSILGPWFAVLDPAEYGVEHRFLFVLGIRF